jgi:hypothetical protein
LNAKKVEAPFKPKVRAVDDVGNFDSYFTSEAPQVSPTAGAAISAEDQAHFREFDSLKRP